MRFRNEFQRIIADDPEMCALLSAMRSFEAPDLWLVSGALFQTVWNALGGHLRGHGIDDYDLFYFDPNTSEEAEDRWIKRAANHLAFVKHPVQLRNQARVHLWYPQKFGIAYPQLTCSCDGVDQFLVQASVVAVRQPSADALDIYAPLGLEDIFNRTLRPNPLWQGPPRKEFETKCNRYRRDWPELTIVE